MERFYGTVPHIPGDWLGELLFVLRKTLQEELTWALSPHCLFTRAILSLATSTFTSPSTLSPLSPLSPLSLVSSVSPVPCHPCVVSPLFLPSASSSFCLFVPEK